MTYYMDAARQPAAADVVASSGRPEPIRPAELYAYAAVQAWAQAVEKAGTRCGSGGRNAAPGGV